MSARSGEGGEVDEAHEGASAEVFAPAVRWGSGEARVHIGGTVGFARLQVAAGEKWSVVGSVSRCALCRPSGGGHRMLPRHAYALSNGPLSLSLTGGEHGARVA